MSGSKTGEKSAQFGRAHAPVTVRSQPAEINSVDKIVRVACRIGIRVGIGLGESWS